MSYELYKNCTEVNAHLAKNWRFSLGISIEENILKLLEELIMAKNAPKTMKAMEIGRMLGGWLKSVQSQ